MKQHIPIFDSSSNRKKPYSLQDDPSLYSTPIRLPSNDYHYANTQKPPLNSKLSLNDTKKNDIRSPTQSSGDFTDIILSSFHNNSAAKNNNGINGRTLNNNSNNKNSGLDYHENNTYYACLNKMSSKDFNNNTNINNNTINGYESNFYERKPSEKKSIFDNKKNNIMTNQLINKIIPQINIQNDPNNINGKYSKSYRQNQEASENINNTSQNNNNSISFERNNSTGSRKISSTTGANKIESIFVTPCPDCKRLINLLDHHSSNNKILEEYLKELITLKCLKKSDPPLTNPNNESFMSSPGGNGEFEGKDLHIDQKYSKYLKTPLNNNSFLDSPNASRNILNSQNKMSITLVDYYTGNNKKKEDSFVRDPQKKENKIKELEQEIRYYQKMEEGFDKLKEKVRELDDIIRQKDEKIKRLNEVNRKMMEDMNGLMRIKIL